MYTPWQLRVWFGITLCLFSFIPLTYHIFQIVRNVMGFETYGFSVGGMLLMLLDSIFITIIESPYISPTACSIFGKAHCITNSIANFVLGYFYFARRKNAFQGLEEDKASCYVSLAWYGFLLSSVILLILFSAFVSYTNISSNANEFDCGIERDNTMVQISFGYLALYNVINGINFVVIFAYPLWNIWGKGVIKRERAILKCTLWIAVYTFSVILSISGFLMSLPGIVMIFLVYSAAYVSIIKQFKGLNWLCAEKEYEDEYDDEEVSSSACKG